MFKRILIANRGEIACRIIKTARRMGIETVAVYSDADKDALHVEMADTAIHIGPPPAAESYLVIDKIVDACRKSGAEAVHPGYGFLSEREAFPVALGKAGIGVISALTFVDTLDNPEAKKFTADYQAKYNSSPDLFCDYGYVGARVIGEALQMTDGDASDKDKLAEAMAKVNFKAPRGPFKFDPATHNPIQDIYIAQVIESGGKITTKVLSTANQVQDPGHKIY